MSLARPTAIQLLRNSGNTDRSRTVWSPTWYDSNDLEQLLQAYMSDSVPLAELEKRYILSVQQQFGGNQVRAAAALGIDRSKLYRRLK